MLNSNTPDGAGQEGRSSKAQVGLLLGIGAAGLLGFFGVPLLSQLNQLLRLDTVEGLWYLTRAAGLVAYLLLWLSTVWGLGVAGKAFDPLIYRAFTFDAHEFISLLAIGFTVLHVGALLADQYMTISLAQILIPFITEYRPLWVGVGIIGAYLTLLVTVTFYIRRWIGQKTFRAIHLFSLVAYIAVTLHSFFAGTDSTLGSAKLIYAGSALVVVILTAHYFVTKRLKNAAPSPAG